MLLNKKGKEKERKCFRILLTIVIVRFVNFAPEDYDNCFPPA